MRKLAVLLVVGLLCGGLVGLGCGEGGGDEDSRAATDAAGDAKDLPGAEVAADAGPEAADVAVPDQADPDADAVPPEVSLDLVPYQAIGGVTPLPAQWSDAGGIAAVELLLDGQVLALLDETNKVIDGTAMPAGLHTLAVRATDAEGNVKETEPVPVVFSGPGQFLAYSDAPAPSPIPGWVLVEKAVPATAASVADSKIHVTMPVGMKKVMGFMHWESDAAWNLRLDVGTGECPDMGEVLVAEPLDAAAGPIAVAYEAADKSDLKKGMWFQHVAYLDGLEHKGESIGLSFLFLVLP